MGFRANILIYTLVPLVAVLVGYSYVRFIVNHDYTVAYEGQCDPATEKCFIGCEDDACTTTYYYTKVQKYAADVYAQCGEDITDCEYASRCLSPSDQKCSVNYCDPVTDGDACETFTEEVSIPTEDEHIEVTEEVLHNETATSTTL